VKLNGLKPSFPVGTFVVNIFGTIILAMAWDLQHAPLGSLGGRIGGGLVGCQVLQGVMDGFCGCLTTVSTWVLELTSLRRKHAYTYGVASVGVALAFMTIIMGSLRWTRGFADPVCSS
jgi:CrcB protein